MKRRNFFKTGLLGASAALVASPYDIVGQPKTQSANFKLNYAPHFGMFKNSAPNGELNELDFMHEAGFRAIEDNEMRNRSVDFQNQFAARMEKHNMTMGVFVAHSIFWTEPNLASGKQDWRNQFLKEIQSSVEVAKRVNAKWMTVVPGHLDLRKDMGYQTANVVESLKQAADILEPHGIVMVLEPLNFRDHPGLFLTKSSQAYEICKAVDSPSCKILFDIYHQQIQEGNLIPNIDLSWDEIAYFQVGDNPGRKEPTTGEINYKNVFSHIHKKGFDGVVGMEHGNSVGGVDGEKGVIAAYKASDSF
jgi:hydroxypyruvate isomerase